MPTYPTTGSTPWNATLRTYVDDADSASAWSRAPRVVDMQFPLLIAHRGGADLGAENSVDAYRNSILLGYTAVEAGDVQALADGTLVIMHDATVDRTTTGTGNVNQFHQGDMGDAEHRRRGRVGRRLHQRAGAVLG